jgi:electron-transferring-flavoprotein dehydrogenase
LWEIDPSKHKPGLVMHTAGWPLQTDTYGGSFLYHMDNNQVVVGFVVGLGYTNPYLSPFEEFQRYKTHPAIRHFLEGGKRVSYGARAIAAGGLMSLPKLVFPGGALVGDDAGFLNASRIKGSHAAIKTGMLAADAAFEAVQAGRMSDELTAYPESFKTSWLHTELYRARNFKQWMSKGLYLGTLMVGIEQKLLGGNVPWTLHHQHSDHEMLKPASQCTPITYPKPDGKLTFDKLGSVFLTGNATRDDAPNHIKIQKKVPFELALMWHYMCPAQVYELPEDVQEKLAAGNGAAKELRGTEVDVEIAPSNCVQCGAITAKGGRLTPPEGGDGPNYQMT